MSQVNAKLPTPPLGKTEVLRWKSKDGLDIEGLLTYPTRYEKGERYPLLLNVHGGPAGVFTQSFVAAPGSYPIAAFSARGYAVLRPNPRGSSGYGKKFRYANYGDWGGGDYHDLMTGVDHVIKLGVADENRLGIMGWSYGGFMTAWTITQTQRFKAASVGAGVTNLMSFTGTSDIPGFLPDYFAGEPWDNFDAYRKRLGHVPRQGRQHADLDPARRTGRTRAALARARAVQRLQAARLRYEDGDLSAHSPRHRGAAAARRLHGTQSRLVRPVRGEIVACESFRQEMEGQVDAVPHGQIGFDTNVGIPAAQGGPRRTNVLALRGQGLRRSLLQTQAVIGAAEVGDENDVVDLVDAHEKVKLGAGRLIELPAACCQPTQALPGQAQRS